MFLTITKRAMVVILAITVTCAAVAASYIAISRKAAANALYTVVIDAGHGGADGGVVGKTYKTKESDINLYVARVLRHYLLKNGINVVMTRDRDVTLSDGKTPGVKLSDMKKRAEIINAAQPDLMISVHQNSYPLTSVKGAQVFYDASEESSRVAAEIFQKTLNDSLGGVRVAKTADYFVLQCSSYPSVLVECGFLSNPEEESLLNTPQYREKVAYALYMSVMLYFDKTNDEFKNIV